MNGNEFTTGFLDHVAIRVRDINVSADWYRDVLGLTKYQLPEWGDYPVFMLSGKTGIALFPAASAAPPGAITTKWEEGLNRKWTYYNLFIDELKPIVKQLKDLLDKYKIKEPDKFIAFGLGKLQGLSIFLSYDDFPFDSEDKLEAK